METPAAMQQARWAASARRRELLKARWLKAGGKERVAERCLYCQKELLRPWLRVEVSGGRLHEQCYGAYVKRCERAAEKKTEKEGAPREQWSNVRGTMVRCADPEGPTLDLPEDVWRLLAAAFVAGGGTNYYSFETSASPYHALSFADGLQADEPYAGCLQARFLGVKVAAQQAGKKGFCLRKYMQKLLKKRYIEWNDEWEAWSKEYVKFRPTPAQLQYTPLPPLAMSEWWLGELYIVQEARLLAKLGKMKAARRKKEIKDRGLRDYYLLKKDFDETVMDVAARLAGVIYSYEDVEFSAPTAGQPLGLVLEWVQKVLQRTLKHRSIWVPAAMVAQSVRRDVRQRLAEENAFGHLETYRVVNRAWVRACAEAGVYPPEVLGPVGGAAVELAREVQMRVDAEAEAEAAAAAEARVG